MLNQVPKNLPLMVAKASNAELATPVAVLQTLWSGYGQIIRFNLSNAKLDRVIVKWVKPPEEMHHPRGWNNSNSQSRKIQSYKVEQNWYKNWSHRCTTSFPVPEYIASSQWDSESLLILEDLDLAGYNYRFQTLSKQGLEACISWLAHFHGEFLLQTPEGLWPIGCYWHLATRADEFKAMSPGPLKTAAQSIDQLLKQAQYQSLVHGDAKLANFCFNENQTRVAALDFQYVGAGVGVKDIAYFLGSCLNNDELFELETWALDKYFYYLGHCLEKKLGIKEREALEKEWRELYPVAVADFARFLEGWRPGHSKLNAYTQEQVKQVLNALD